MDTVKCGVQYGDVVLFVDSYADRRLYNLGRVVDVRGKFVKVVAMDTMMYIVYVKDCIILEGRVQ